MASSSTTVSSSTPLTEVTGDYDLDPAHSRLGFSARHAMVTTVRGSFTAFSGRLRLDGDNPSASTAELDIDAASIDTGHPDRDGHLRSADFLDVEQYPALTFRSSKAARTDDETYTMAGQLTIRGVSRDVELDLTYQGSATDPFGNLRAGFEGTTTISRKDWGLTYNAALETGGVLIGDKIKIELDVSAIKRV